MAKPSRYELLRSSTKSYVVLYLFSLYNVIVIFFYKQVSV